MLRMLARATSLAVAIVAIAVGLSIALVAGYAALEAQVVTPDDSRLNVAKVTLINAVATDETTGAVNFTDKVPTSCTIYIEWSAGTTSGVVYVEEAYQSSYAGTWSVIQVVNWPAATVVDTVHVPTPVGAIRTRIETAIGGGTVTTRAVCA